MANTLNFIRVLRRRANSIFFYFRKNVLDRNDIGFFKMSGVLLRFAYFRTYVFPENRGNRFRFRRTRFSTLQLSRRHFVNSARTLLPTIGTFRIRYDVQFRTDVWRSKSDFRF